MAFGFSAGGAGYGDPLEADPEDVARDFAGGLISAWTMSEIYKVAYDEVDELVLPAETEALRTAEREARAARDSDWLTFDAAWSQLSPPEDLLVWFGSWPEGIPAAPVTARRVSLPNGEVPEHTDSRRHGLVDGPLDLARPVRGVAHGARAVGPHMVEVDGAGLGIGGEHDRVGE